MRITIIIPLLLLIFAALTQAKFSVGETKLHSENTEAYLGKFSYSSHLDGSIDGEFTLDGPGAEYYLRRYQHRLTVSLFDDAGNDKYQKMLKKGSLCDDRNKVAIQRYVLKGTANPKLLHFHHKVKQSPDVLNLHAYLTDCPLEFVNVPVNDAPVIKYRLKFLNADNHLPQDEIHMPQVLLGLFIIVCLITGVYAWLLININKTQHQIHLVQLLSILGFIMVILSIGAQLLHLTVYSKDGMGLKLRYTIFAMDFVSEIFQFGSELIVSFIFIAIASFGWLYSNKSSQMSTVLITNNTKKSFFILTLLSYIFIVLILQYQNRKYEEDFNYFQYNTDHIPGVLLITLRILTMCVFLFTINYNYNTTKHNIILSLLPIAILNVLHKIQLINAQQLERYTMTKANTVGLDHNSSSNAGNNNNNNHILEKVPLMGISPISSIGSPVFSSPSTMISPTTSTTSSVYLDNEDYEIQNIIRNITLIGLIWFLSYPVASFLAHILVNPSNWRIFTITLSLVVHIGVLLFFMFAFGYQHSTYYKTSSLMNMGTIFGGGDDDGKKRKIAID